MNKNPAIWHNEFSLYQMNLIGKELESKHNFQLRVKDEKWPTLQIRLAPQSTWQLIPLENRAVFVWILVVVQKHVFIG